MRRSWGFNHPYSNRPGGGFKLCFIFTPILFWKISNLTNIFRWVETTCCTLSHPPWQVKLWLGIYVPEVSKRLWEFWVVTLTLRWITLNLYLHFLISPPWRRCAYHRPSQPKLLGHRRLCVQLGRWNVCLLQRGILISQLRLGNALPGIATNPHKAKKREIPNSNTKFGGLFYFLGLHI